MQKKLIALAVAGLASTAAFAQSNVTIYGQMDLGYVGGTAKEGSAAAANKRELTGINGSVWGSSRIGFKGEEALGNGMKALFAIEYKLSNDNSTTIGGTGNTSVALNSAGARQQYIGLTGNFGTVVGGYLQPMSKGTVDKFGGMDANNQNPLGLLLKGVNGGTLVSTMSDSSRLGNAVAYVTPTMNGFTGQIAYAFGGRAAGDAAYATTTDQERVLGLGVNYDNGPIAAGLIYHNGSNLGNTLVGAAESEVRDVFAGASYDFGVVKLIGAYTTHRYNVAGAAATKDKIWNLAVDVPVGANGMVYADYASLNNDSTGTVVDAKSFQLAYKHKLSKRTYLYTGYTSINNDGAESATQTTSVTGVPGAAGALGTNQDNRGWFFGAHHDF